MNHLAQQAQEVESQQNVAVRCAAGTLSEDQACDLIRDAINAQS